MSFLKRHSAPSGQTEVDRLIERERDLGVQADSDVLLTET
jgi:hypothetical protein